MPQYVNQERGGHTGQTQKRSDGRRGAIAEERRRRSPRRRRHTACGGRRPAVRRAVPPGRGPAPPPRSRPVESAGPPPRPPAADRMVTRDVQRFNAQSGPAMSHRKNETKTTRGSHVLETDGMGLRHPPPARRGMLAHPHRTACPRPRHPGSSIDDRGCATCLRHTVQHVRDRASQPPHVHVPPGALSLHTHPH